MKFEVKDAPRKIATFWISAEEAEDKVFMASLKPQFAIWKDKGYLPVVMESGKGRLEDSLYLLMKHNYELLAQKQLAAEKASL